MNVLQWGHQTIDAGCARAGWQILLAAYSIAAIVLWAILARAVISFFKAVASAVKLPCFRAFLLPFGAPPLAPCIRHTSRPKTAGDRHGFPLRFDLARHLNARCIGQCMGLNL
jgi:hypothetical protein